MSGARVLLVEDDALLLMELEAVLLESGADIAGLCRSVAEALAVVEQGGIDAAILDFGLGDDTVAPLADRLAADGTPFCFYTGQVATDPRLAAWHGCAILQKPAHPQAIVAAVAALVSGRAEAPVATIRCR